MSGKWLHLKRNYAGCEMISLLASFPPGHIVTLIWNVFFSIGFRNNGKIKTERRRTIVCFNSEHETITALNIHVNYIGILTIRMSVINV